MWSGRIQFDWQRRRPPEPMSFGFYFDPILPRLRGLWWVCDCWPLGWPISPEAKAALTAVDAGLTPPDTVLPKLARQIIGARDEFVGLPQPPAPARAFKDGLWQARQADRKEREDLGVVAPIGRKALERFEAQYRRKMKSGTSHTDSYLDDSGVEFAFLTNDTVWWVAARAPDAMDALAQYAKRTPGMSFQHTMGWGM